LRGEVVPVDAGAPDRDEEVARPDPARIHGHAGQLGVAAGGGTEGGGELGHGEVHGFLASSAAIRRASEGVSSAPITWTVSWPLPAITTTDPAGSAFPSAIARWIASRRSGIRRLRVAPAFRKPTTTSSRIASGRSERGLSEVAIATSAILPAI